MNPYKFYQQQRSRIDQIRVAMEKYATVYGSYMAERERSQRIQKGDIVLEKGDDGVYRVVLESTGVR